MRTGRAEIRWAVNSRRYLAGLLLTVALIVAVLAVIVVGGFVGNTSDSLTEESSAERIKYQPRYEVDASGFALVEQSIATWKPDATLEQIGDAWRDAGRRATQQIDDYLRLNPGLTRDEKYTAFYTKAAVFNYDGEPKKAYEVLQQARLLIQGDAMMNRELSYSIVYLQGVSALRRGENENCIMCRGESSCIIPISRAAVHTRPEGSRLAIFHFMEYLNEFPDDLAVRWLLNIAHMTLGEHPDKVDPRFLVSLKHFNDNQFDIGRFRDIGHIVGVNQLTQAGGAIMEDFDNDGLLDIAVTTMDPTGEMNLLRNVGDGAFKDETRDAGLAGQYGGLNCVQTDYNNDGRMDIFIVRGAWVSHAMRPSLLRNDGNGKFSDVTREAGLIAPMNSISSSWADYDNDGWVDVFMCGERQPSRLYRNLGNGTFEEVAMKAGVSTPSTVGCKAVAWVDVDNDGFPDLFQNYLLPTTPAKLFHNNRDGTFEDVTDAYGIEGPVAGFSCWAWDYDNDGWLDIFATCYDRTLGDVVKGLLGQPHERSSNRLYRNLRGTGFEDVTKEAGLDLVLGTMGSNFGDFDNDGFLDMFLGTGEPDIATLIPNRMFRNIAGKRFAEITASSGTGNLQKGHGVACGDWNRDGNTDIFIKMGGAVNGDKYHNILFQNPGHKNSWLTVKLTGEKSNRAAIGARIKVVTVGDMSREFHRHVSSGSSFGANPLQQTIGLADAERIATLEIHWPTSGTTQVFHDLAVNQAIAITEFAGEYQKLDWQPVPVPQAQASPKMTKAQDSALSR